MHSSVEMQPEDIGLKTEAKSNSNFVFELRCMCLEFFWCICFVAFFYKLLTANIISKKIF
ncbi:hypothetical protein ACSLPA_33035, partial [Escherichia coli]